MNVNANLADVTVAGSSVPTSLDVGTNGNLPANTVVLRGNNTYSGGTILNSGILSIATNSDIRRLNHPDYLQRWHPAAQCSATITNLDSHTVNWDLFNSGLALQMDQTSGFNYFTISQSIGSWVA